MNKFQQVTYSWESSYEKLEMNLRILNIVKKTCRPSLKRFEITGLNNKVRTLWRKVPRSLFTIYFGLTATLLVWESIRRISREQNKQVSLSLPNYNFIIGDRLECNNMIWNAPWTGESSQAVHCIKGPKIRISESNKRYCHKKPATQH